MIGQNIQSKHSEALAEATYDNDLEMHKHIDEMHSDIKIILLKKNNNEI